MVAPRELTVGVFGHYGNENMGDEAIVAAVIEEVRRRYPKARVLGFSIVPEDTRRRHGIESYPIRRDTAPANPKLVAERAWSEPPEAGSNAGIRSSLKSIPLLYPALRGVRNSIRFAGKVISEIKFLQRSYKIVKTVDLMLVSGSGQLTDQSGVWGFPYTLYKWSVLCSLGNCKWAFVGVGAGPLDTKLGRWFDKQALRRAGFRSYRDESSHRLISSLGIGEDDLVCPDLAFGKQTHEPRPVPTDPNCLVVGINPMAYHDPRYWPNASKTTFETYIDNLTQVIVRIAELGDSVVLFPTQLRADVLVISQLQPVLDRICSRDIRSRISVAKVGSLETQLSVMSTFDVIIATRFHGVLKSYLVGKPTIGISYHPKINDLTAYMGHPECALPIDPLDVEAVIRVYLDLKGRLKDSQRIVLEKREEKRQELSKMYDQLFETLLPK